MFSVPVLAAEDPYMDGETVVKLYTELFDKYYSGEGIVDPDTSNYIPVEASTFYKELEEMEKNIKKILNQTIK